MELLLIRHALPLRREVDDGPADPELSEQGHAQARLLAEYLRGEQLDGIFSSPLNRARQTAEPVAEGRTAELVLLDGVAEWDRNSNEYIPVEELRAANDPRWLAIARGEMHGADESPDEFRSRVVGTIEDLIEAFPGNQRIAVFCHGGVIGGYLSHILEHHNPSGFFYPNYTSINRVIAARTGQRSILTANETSHLRGSGLPMGVYQHG